jgi:hypothetical protein
VGATPDTCNVAVGAGKALRNLAQPQLGGSGSIAGTNLRLEPSIPSQNLRVLGRPLGCGFLFSRSGAAGTSIASRAGRSSPFGRGPRPFSASSRARGRNHDQRQ